jgi:signal transduction histidine kinase
MKKTPLSRTIRVPLIYCAFSILWIFATDKLNSLISSDIAKATTIAMIKGTAFVLVSTFLIYFLLRVDERQKTSLNSELKIVKESFDSLFARNPLPIWMYDPESKRFLAVNEAACSFYACAQEKFLKIKLANLCAADEYSRLISEMGTESFYKSLSGPWRQITCGGDPLDVELFPLQVQYAGRNVTMMMVFDLSRQLKVEAALKTTATQRDDYEAFSYSVSHDLRAPLRTINGYGKLLMSDFAPQVKGEMHSYLAAMIQASQEMNQMIDNLLMLSHLKRGSLNYGYIDLAELAKGIIKQVCQQEPDRVVEFKSGKAAMVTADAALMKNLLHNLIENAWKYTAERNPARIEFGSLVDPVKGRVYFVKDNGLGFSEHEAAELFKPFQRTPAVGDYPGMGIGLSIAARIVERHGGQIWAEGKRDKGATFYFTLGEG